MPKSTEWASIPILHTVGDIKVGAVVERPIAEKLPQLVAWVLNGNLSAAETLTVGGVLAVDRRSIGEVGFDRLKRDDIVIVGTAQTIERDTGNLLYRLTGPDRGRPRGMCNDGEEDLIVDGDQAQGTVDRAGGQGAVVPQKLPGYGRELNHALGNKRLGSTARPRRRDRGVGAGADGLAATGRRAVPQD